MKIVQHAILKFINYLIDDKMNCKLCKINYYKINGTNNCYKDDILVKDIILKI